MSKIISLLAAALLSVSGLVAQATGDTKAAELLAQARVALGGEKPLAKVQGLSCAGTVQRLVGDRQIGGELTLDVQLPDKMLRSESISPMGDGALVVTDQGVNGERLLRGARTVNAPPGMIIRLPPPPAAGSDAEAQALRNSRAELARMAVALLLAAPQSMGLEFRYGGEAEAADGKADILQVKGAEQLRRADVPRQDDAPAADARLQGRRAPDARADACKGRRRRAATPAHGPGG